MNYREINEVISEIHSQSWLLQQAVQPDFDRIYIEFHDGTVNHWLLFVMKSPFTRFHLSRPPLKRKGAKPRFAELINARLAGARVTNLFQINNDRIVLMELQLENKTLRLVTRLWNNAANMLVLDDQNSIIDSFFRRPARNEISGSTFNLPSPAGTLDTTSSEIALLTKHAVLPEFPQIGTYPFNQYMETEFTILESQELKKRLLDAGNRLVVELGNSIESRLRKLENRIAKAKEHNEWKAIGDLVLANAWHIHKGVCHVDLEDWRTSDKTIRIPLDPKLDAVQNAHVYYQRFQKDRDALTYLEDDFKLKMLEHEHFSALAAEFRIATEISDLKRISEAMTAMKESNKGNVDSPDHDSIPGARFNLHGYPVLVGRNARESDELLRHHVRGNDLWLHVRDFPGGYVFVRVPRGKTIPSDVLIDAAHLAAWYSKGKEEKELDLYYTHVKYLRRPKNAKLGTVLPTQERNLHLRVEETRLNSILDPGS